MSETPAPIPPEEEPVTSRDEAGEPDGERAVPASPPHPDGERAAPASAPDPNGERAVPASPPHPIEAEEPLARTERERDEYLDLARRAQADFENYRKRAARETAAAGERARSGLVRELLPVVDNLERALASAHDSDGDQGLAGTAGSPDGDQGLAGAAGSPDGDQGLAGTAGSPLGHLAAGVRLVHSELIAVLERNGVQQFDPSGERFDPNEHEALSMRPDEAAESGTVIDVVEKGYRSNGSVLRPARVVVSC